MAYSFSFKYNPLADICMISFNGCHCETINPLVRVMKMKMKML